MASLNDGLLPMATGQHWDRHEADVEVEASTKTVGDHNYCI